MAVTFFWQSESSRLSRRLFDNENSTELNSSTYISTMTREDKLEDFKLEYIIKIKEQQLEGELIKIQVEEKLERERLYDAE